MFIKLRETSYSIIALGLLWLVTAPLAGAQEPRRLATPDSIPLELATALISAGGLGGDPQILVGSLPGWVENRVNVPAGARVLGAAFIGQTAVGVLAVTNAPEAAIADLKRELSGRGWKAPPPPPSYGGFRSAPSLPAGSSPTNVTLCDDQQMLIASAVRHRGTTTVLTLRVSTVGQYSQCNPPSSAAFGSRPPTPTLFNPPGLNDGRLNGDCLSTSNNSVGSGTNLRTPMASNALLDHYGAQLADSGWHAAIAGGTVAGRTWTRADSTGTPVELVLTVATAPRDSTCKDINMQVRTMRKP